MRRSVQLMLILAKTRAQAYGGWLTKRYFSAMIMSFVSRNRLWRPRP